MTNPMTGESLPVNQKSSSAFRGDQEDARLLPRLSTTKSTALVTSAGRELDALVAEMVMGFSWQGKPRGNRSFHDVHGKQVGVKERGKPFVAFGSIHSTFLPHYSTSIADAWLVVEKLSGQFHWRIQSPFIAGDSSWRAGLTPLGSTGWNGRPDYQMEADSAPFAICLAALKAVGA